MSTHSRTMVGGRTGGSDRHGDHPRGIEILLKKAKVNPEFRELLLEDPDAAATSIDLTLQENERRIMANTPRSLLSTMIQNTFVPRHHVRSFITQKAPALILLLLASTVAIDPATGAPAGERAMQPSAGVRTYSSESLNEEAAKKMRLVQVALERYKEEHGQYPWTEQWMEPTNPLSEWIQARYLYDPWGNKLHYEGLTNERGEVINYHLESTGYYSSDPNDNIPCPIDPELHAFPETK